MAQVWAESCARCHNAHPPGSYGDAEWDVSVRHMRLRAYMTAEDEKAVLKFLKAAN